jgi:hypothetical protein
MHDYTTSPPQTNGTIAFARVIMRHWGRLIAIGNAICATESSAHFGYPHPARRDDSSGALRSNRPTQGSRVIAG